MFLSKYIAFPTFSSYIFTQRFLTRLSNYSNTYIQFYLYQTYFNTNIVLCNTKKYISLLQYVKPEAAITVFELLMMSSVSLETCWASNKTLE